MHCFAPLTLTLLFCSACTPAPQDPLRIGFNPWPAYEFIYLAKVKGFYEKEGIKIKLVELNTLGDVRRAFERGQIDMMATTTVEAAIAVENSGKKLKIIAVTDTSNGADAMIAPLTTPSMAALAGKKVGMEGITVDVLNSYYALASAGLSLQDITVVNKTQDDLLLDMEQGKLDAIQTYPPYSLKLLATGKYHKLFDSTKIPGKVIDIISVDANLLKSRPQDIRRFTRSFFAAMDYFSRHRTEAAEIIGQRTAGNATSFQESLTGLQLVDLSGQADYLKPQGKAYQALKNTCMALTITGHLKKPVQLDDFFDPAVSDFYH
ncbi:MAG: ABC transporter substrate-binding protein [Iodobacter sp.]